MHTLSKEGPEPLGKHPNITNQVASRKARTQIDGTKANLLKMRLVAGDLLQQAAFVFDTVLYALHPIYSPFSLEPFNSRSYICTSFVSCCLNRIPASIQSYQNSTRVWSFENYDTELSPSLRILLGSILWSSHGSVLIDPNFYLNLLLFEKGAGITFVISSYLECIIATKTLLSTHNRFMGLGDFMRAKFTMGLNSCNQSFILVAQKAQK